MIKKAQHIFSELQRLHATYAGGKVKNKSTFSRRLSLHLQRAHLTSNTGGSEWTGIRVVENLHQALW